MKVSEVLKAGKAVIADPKNWAKEWFAYDEQARMTESCSPDAVCWCSTGALSKVAPKDMSTRFKAENWLHHAADTADPDSPVHCMPYYNDTHTHEEVMAVWDAAIKLAEESERAPVL